MGNIYTNGLVGRCGYCTMSLVLMVPHNNLLYSYDVQIYVISTSRFCNHIQILCYIYSQNCLFCTFFIRTYVRVWQLRHIIFLHLHDAQLGISFTSINTFCVLFFHHWLQGMKAGSAVRNENFISSRKIKLYFMTVPQGFVPEIWL